MPSTIDLRDVIVHYGSVDESLVNTNKQISILEYEKDHVQLEYFRFGSLSAHPIKIKYDESVPGTGPVATLRAMARNAALKLGRPVPRTNEVLCPGGKPGEKLMYLFLIVLAITTFKPQWIRQLSQLRGFSKISDLLLTHGKLLFAVVYGVHVFEIVFIMIPDLKRHRVPLKNWPSWIIMNFVEGFFALLRFKSLTDSDI